MLNSTDRMICTFLAAAGLSLAAAESRADLFDFLRPKRATAVSRAQSPDGRTFGAGTYSSRNLWQPQQSAMTQNTQGASTGGIPATTVPSGWGYDAAPEINCGECDRHQGRVSFCRKICHETYYPRSAPYCMPDWGWNQTCWRRMKDNYNCPRPDYHASTPEPLLPLPPQTPVMPPATTYLPAQRSQGTRAVNYGRPRQELENRQPYQGHSPLRGRTDAGTALESESESGGWNYEEEAEVQPVATPPRETGRASYYVPPAARR